jgi:hypothetical protein
MRRPNPVNGEGIQLGRGRSINAKTQRCRDATGEGRVERRREHA